MKRIDFENGTITGNILGAALPMLIAQILNLLYNIVDRIYIARIPEIGTAALGAVGLCFPIIVIITAFSNLFGTGGAPLFSIFRGKKDPDTARRIMNTSFTMLCVCAMILMAVGFLFARPILILFGASTEAIVYAYPYMMLYLIGTLPSMIAVGMNPFINAQGFGKMGMCTVALGAVVNIVLDPIFIFALNLGAGGAALATVLSQCCSAVWVLKFLTGRRALLRLRWNTLRLQAARVRRILALGTSGFVMSMTNSLVQVLCNASLQHYGGDLYVGVMTVINSIREVVSMPVQGITNGCQPVLGYNYGAGEYERVRRGIRFTTVLTVGYSVAAWALVMAVPELLIRIFNDEPELIAAGIPAFRLYFAAFFCMSFQFIGQSVFVGLGRSRSAVFFSLLRKAFIVAPLTLLLPGLGMGVDGVFAAEPVSNVLGGLACLLTMYITVYRRLGR